MRDRWLVFWTFFRAGLAGLVDQRDPRIPLRRWPENIVQSFRTAWRVSRVRLVRW